MALHGMAALGCKDTLSFNILPPEMLSHIFYFLPYWDLKQARLVSQQWYMASLHPKLLQREKLVLDDRHCDDRLELVKCKRDFAHVWLEDDYLFGLNDNFWVQHGSSVKSLRLFQFGMYRHELFSILSHCPRLNHLELEDYTMRSRGDETYGYNSTADSKLRLYHLKSLRITSVSPNAISLELFESLVALAPNLQSLCLDNCLVHLNHQDDSLCTVRHVLVYLRENAGNITSLDITLRWRLPNESHCTMEDEKVLFEILLLPNLQLQTLALDFQLIDKALFLKIVRSEKLRHIRKLKLIMKIDDKIFQAICSNISSLQCLELRFLDNGVKSAGFQALSSIECLTELAIGTNEIDLDDWEKVIKALCSKIDTSLNKLSFWNCRDLSPHVFVCLVETHTKLRYLALTDCDGVRDDSIQAVFRHLTLLKTLKLNQCKNLTDVGLTGWSTDEDNKDMMKPQEHGISQLKNLQALELCCCRRITGAFLYELVLPNLTYLNLDDNQLIPEEAFICVIKNHRFLEKLSLTHNPGVTNNVARVIAKSERIRAVRVWDSSVTDDVIRELSRDGRRVY